MISTVIIGFHNFKRNFGFKPFLKFQLLIMITFCNYGKWRVKEKVRFYTFWRKRNSENLSDSSDNIILTMENYRWLCHLTYFSIDPSSLQSFNLHVGHRMSYRSPLLISLSPLTCSLVHIMIIFRQNKIWHCKYGCLN